MNLTSFLFPCGFCQVLKDTLTTLHEEGDENPYYQKVRTYVLNPKVCTCIMLVVSCSMRESFTN